MQYYKMAGCVFQGRIQNLKLGVAQTDWKPGGGGGVLY